MFQTEIITCGNCRNRCDQHYRIPIVIPLCGHTICSICLAENTKENSQTSCPISGCELMLQKASLSLESSQSDTCPEHSKDLNFVCLTDKCKICKNCAKGAHKSHNIKHKNDFISEINSMMVHLDECNEIFEKEKQEITKFLNKKKEDMLQVVSLKFNKIREIINTKEEQELAEIKSLFDKETEILEKKKEEQASLRSSLEMNRSHLVNFRIDKSLLELFEKSQSIIISNKTNQQRITSLLDAEEHKVKLRFERFEEFEAIYDSLNLNETENRSESHENEGKIDTNSVDMIVEQSPGIPEAECCFQVEEKDGWLEILIQSQRNNNDMKIWEDPAYLKDKNKLYIKFNKAASLEDTLSDLNKIWMAIEKVSELKVTITHKDFNDEGLKSFCSKGFWINEKIESFRFMVDAECNITDSSLKEIMIAISKMSKLKELLLGLESTKMTDSSLETFSRTTLPALKNLRALELYVDQTKVTETGIDLLFHELKKYKTNLETITLGFDQTQVTNANIIKFSKENLPRMCLLESLNLNLNGTKVTDKGLCELFRERYPNKKNPKSWILDFGGTELTHKSVQAFAKSWLKPINNLETLKLYLDNTNFNDKGMEQLAQDMQTVATKMKTCLMNFNRTQIGNKGVEAFATYTAPYFKNLQEFQLLIGSTKVLDTGLVKLLKALRGVADKLKTFKLCLSVTDITDETIQVLTDEVIPVMKSIEDFDLDIDTTRVAENKIENLSKAMQGIFNNIKLFSMNLNNNPVISNRWLIHFANEVLPGFGSLQTLELKLHGSEISDEGLQVLGRQIPKTIKNANTILLSLGETEITVEGLQKFIRKSSSLTGLKALKLNLQGIQIDESVIENIMESLINPIQDLTLNFATDDDE